MDSDISAGLNQATENYFLDELAITKNQLLQLHTLDPFNHTINYYLCFTLYHLNNKAESIKYLFLSYDLNSSQMFRSRFLADYLFLTGRTKDALLIYQTIIQYFHSSPHVNQNMALCLILESRISEAKLTLQHVIQLRQDFLRTYDLLAGLYSHHDIQSSISIYKQGIANNPSTFQIYFKFGLFLSRNNLKDQSIYYFNKVLELRPNHLFAQEQLAFVLQRLGRINDVITIYKNLITSHPKREENFLKLAKTLIKLNKFTETINCLEKAIEMHPNSIDAHLLLAEIYVRFGNYNKASLIIDRIS